MFWAQKTLKGEVSCTGIGLHTGKKINLRIRPAPPDTGIVFRRVDLLHKPQIKAHIFNVIDDRLATTLGKDGVEVKTVEHLLAAFFGMGIDNVIVELDAPEVPIMDGSAGPFVYLLKMVGFKYQPVPKRLLILKKSLWLKENEKWIRIRPARDEGLTIKFTIDFDHPLLRKQSYTFHFSTKNFEKEVCRARTFGFLKDVEKLKAEGLIKGGSLDNAVVIDDFRVINREGVRYKNEFVRHKILDLLGDLTLLGYFPIARIDAYKAGHALNHKMAQKLWQEKHAWELMTLSAEIETSVKQKLRK